LTEAAERTYRDPQRDPMEIGKPQRVVTVEPVRDPVPREAPAKEPRKQPRERPKVPEKEGCRPAQAASGVAA
jgi:hypothetical protein